MNENPYEAPETDGGELALSLWRIPLAAICTVIALFFVGIVFKCVVAISDVGIYSCLTTRAGRGALIGTALSTVGIFAFGLIAIGLSGKRPRLVAIGLALFALGASVEVLVIVWRI